MRKSVYQLSAGDVVRCFNGTGDQVVSCTDIVQHNKKKRILVLVNKKTGVRRRVVWGYYTKVSMQPIIPSTAPAISIRK